MESPWGLLGELSHAVLTQAGRQAGSAQTSLHTLVERFLDLPIALQILLLVLALPGGAVLVTGVAVALRTALTHRRGRPR